MTRTGTLSATGWVAAGSADPRAEIARRVVDACRGARCVVAYYARFERTCLQHLQRAVPELASELQSVIDPLVDPLPVIREHVYHPQFHGSFGLKSVLPTLVPGMGYGDLTIKDGETAAAMPMEVIFSEPGEREGLRAALAAYCERDIEGTARLLEALGRLESR